MTLTRQDIQRILPHRYPFLMIHSIEAFVDDQTIIARKDIHANDAIFIGHFPDNPVFPGVLLVEALAQTGAVLLLSKPEFKNKDVYLTGINHMRFKKKVIPGDTVFLHSTLKSLRKNIGSAQVYATVNGERVCEGEIVFVIDPSI